MIGNECLAVFCPLRSVIWNLNKEKKVDMFFPVLILRLLGSSDPSGEEEQLARFEYTQLHMGVQARIVLYAPDQAVAERACRAAFRRIAEIEDIMSDYRPTSELMRLCAKAGGTPVPVSEELFFVLQRAQQLSARSGGAFDVTVGPYVALWRRARKTGQFPSEAELQQARARVGWQKIRLDAASRTAQLIVSGMRLDLGGIAKGYACDEALKTLKRHGVDRALIEMGGDLVLGEAPPGEKGWRIKLPIAKPRTTDQVLTLAKLAISTSGDLEQYVEFKGRRYSHIIDPRTGLGVTNRVQATVIAPDGITADSLATALCVLGEKRGRLLLRAYPGTKVYFRRAVSK